MHLKNPTDTLGEPRQLTDNQLTDNQLTDNQLTDNQLTDSHWTPLSIDLKNIYTDSLHMHSLNHSNWFPVHKLSEVRF